MGAVQHDEFGHHLWVLNGKEPGYGPAPVVSDHAAPVVPWETAHATATTEEEEQQQEDLKNTVSTSDTRRIRLLLQRRRYEL